LTQVKNTSAGSDGEKFQKDACRFMPDRLLLSAIIKKFNPDLAGRMATAEH
jgi:hypothetical protein